MDKLEIFKRELAFIKSEEVKEKVKELIGKLPDYFFSVGASSTGKHHPNYAQGKGGLIRHTQAAARIANDLLNLEMFKGLSEEKDHIIAALLLHDGLKHGENHEPYSRADHPIIMSNFIMNELEGSELAYILSDLVLTHMGQWNTGHRSKEEIMPKPTSKIQSFVHLCDYLASRKFFEFNFEV